jgi:hypothetical protein
MNPVDEQGIPSPAVIDRYLRSRARSVRWSEWLIGKRYLTARFADRATPLVVIAHSFRDAAKAREFAVAIVEDWAEVTERSREAYDEILFRAPVLVVVEYRRRNLCGCLGHRHVVVKEKAFAEPHDSLGGASVGELDIAFERVESWQALPLSDIALDTKFLEGSRLEEFRRKQFRLRLLSVLLHETHHLAFPHEPESVVREKSLAFYRAALADYVEKTVGTLSLTIDRSFSRFG